MRSRYLILSAVTLALVGAPTGYLLNDRYARITATDQTCVSTKDAGPYGYSLVIVGESWAADGRMLPAFEKYLIKQKVNDYKVCSVGYSGKTATEIARGVSADFKGSFDTLFDETPDQMVLLTGINDVYQHIGTVSYISGLAKLLSVPAKEHFVVEIPAVDFGRNYQRSLPSRAKAFVFRWIFDGGRVEVMDHYRAAVQQANFPIVTTSDFSATYKDFPLTVDGLHPTPDGFDMYADHIAEQIIAK